MPRFVLRSTLTAAGRFLLLGSAAGDLLRQSGESLAGRVSYVELTPLLAAELPVAELADLQCLGLREGFPLSYLAPDDEASYAWRQDFIRTLLQRDLPGMGVRVPAETLRRFWQMLAPLQGQLFNAFQLGMSLGGASHSTASRYLDVLVDTMMVRRLQPHLANVGKRLVKSPKVYLREPACCMPCWACRPCKTCHPVAGASWEGFVVKQVAAALPPDAQLGFCRTAAGTELDLVIEQGARKLGVEIKFSSAPKPTKGFWQALQDLQIDCAYVVAPVPRRYPLVEGVEVIPVGAVNAIFNR